MESIPQSLFKIFERDLFKNSKAYSFFIGSVAEWLEHRDCDRHGLGLKPTRAILLCPWKRNFAASPAWWCWQALLKLSHIFINISKNQIKNFNRTVISSYKAIA